MKLKQLQKFKGKSWINNRDTVEQEQERENWNFHFISPHTTEKFVFHFQFSNDTHPNKRKWSFCLCIVVFLCNECDFYLNFCARYVHDDDDDDIHFCEFPFLK